MSCWLWSFHLIYVLLLLQGEVEEKAIALREAKVNDVSNQSLDLERSV